MTLRPASPANGQAARSANAKGDGDQPEGQAAKDRRILRERAERLMRTAHATDDADGRRRLILEAAMLHRLATVVEAQAAKVAAYDRRLDVEPRSFAFGRRRWELLH